MSKLSIYETSWTDLVFENRNKEYGAYLLRQENNKTTVFAFFTGLLFLTAAISLPVLYSHFSTENRIIPIVPQLLPAVTVNLETIIKPKQDPIVEKPIVVHPKAPIAQTAITQKQLSNPLLVEATVDVPELATNAAIVNSTSTINTGAVGTGSSGASTGASTVISSPGITESTIVSAVALDKLPEFPGGINKFYNYVGTNFEKPEIELERAIKVHVSFVVEKDGSMTDIKVLRDPGYGLGKEAIRVLKSLKTKWSPGMLDGKAVRTAYNLPITIQTN